MSDDIDPVCLIHGKKHSEHRCLYCCLCFKHLEPDQCAFKPDGKREDVCVECAENEIAVMIHGTREYNRITQERRNRLPSSGPFLHQETITKLRADALEESDGDADRECGLPYTTLLDLLDAAEKLPLVTKERDQALADAGHWKANHDNQVVLKAAIMDRPDMKERAALVTKMAEENAALQIENARLKLDGMKIAAQLTVLETMLEHELKQARGEFGQVLEQLRATRTFQGLSKRHENVLRFLAEADPETLKSFELLQKLQQRAQSEGGACEI